MNERVERTPVRVNPFGELETIGEWPRPGLSRLMRDFFGPTAEQRGVLWAPATDVAESDSGYVVTVELAGASKDDVTVECHDNVLVIKGEKKHEREEKGERRHYVERSFGSFSRSFRLPDDAAGEQVKASFRDGVLTVEVPRTEERKPKVVAIES